MDYNKILGKPVQILLEKWSPSAMGMLQESELGHSWLKLIPFAEGSDLEKAFPNGVVQTLHVRIEDIRGLFEIDITKHERNTKQREEKQPKNISKEINTGRPAANTGS